MRNRFVQKQVGVRLKALRKEKTGLSQEKFAYSIGVDRAYYAHDYCGPIATAFHA